MKQMQRILLKRWRKGSMKMREGEIAFSNGYRGPWVEMKME